MPSVGGSVYQNPYGPAPSTPTPPQTTAGGASGGGVMGQTPGGGVSSGGGPLPPMPPLPPLPSLPTPIELATEATATARQRAGRAQAGVIDRQRSASSQAISGGAYGSDRGALAALAQGATQGSLAGQQAFDSVVERDLAAQNQTRQFNANLGQQQYNTVTNQYQQQYQQRVSAQQQRADRLMQQGLLDAQLRAQLEEAILKYGATSNGADSVQRFLEWLDGDSSYDSGVTPRNGTH